MTQWLRSHALPEGDKAGLLAATGAVESIASQPVGRSPALYSTQPSAISDAELKLARSAAIAQPLPLQVSVSSTSMPAAAGLTQAATATLAQVQPSADAAYAQAMTMTQSTAGPNARQATMDRFAMRGVAVKSNQL